MSLSLLPCLPSRCGRHTEKAGVCLQAMSPFRRTAALPVTLTHFQHKPVTNFPLCKCFFFLFFCGWDLGTFRHFTKIWPVPADPLASPRPLQGQTINAKVQHWSIGSQNLNDIHEQVSHLDKELPHPKMCPSLFLLVVVGLLSKDMIPSSDSLL